MSNLGAFAWILFLCAILAHAGVKTEVFYSIYWLHIHRDKVSMHLYSEMGMERGRKIGMEAQSGKEEVGILHFAYKEVSVGRSNAAARGKKKGEGNGGTHHHPSGGASSTV